MKKKVINDNNGWINKINILGKIAAMITKYGFIKIISSFLVLSMFAIMIIIFMNQKTIVAKVLEEQKQEINAILSRINYDGKINVSAAFIRRLSSITEQSARKQGKAVFEPLNEGLEIVW